MHNFTSPHVSLLLIALSYAICTHIWTGHRNLSQTLFRLYRVGCLCDLMLYKPFGLRHTQHDQRQKQGTQELTKHTVEWPLYGLLNAQEGIELLQVRQQLQLAQPQASHPQLLLDPGKGLAQPTTAQPQLSVRSCHSVFQPLL